MGRARGLLSDAPSARNGLRALPAGLVVARFLAVQEFFDKAGRFELVEPLDAFAEPFLGQRLGLLLVEVVFADDLQDQVLRFFGAVPTVLF